MTLFVLKGLLFIVFLETAFPSYPVTVIKEDGEIISYGVSKKQIESLTDESGMLDLEALDKLTN